MFEILKLSRGNFAIVRKETLREGKINSMPLEVHGLIYVYAKNNILDYIEEIAISDELKESGELKSLKHRALKYVANNYKGFWFKIEDSKWIKTG